MNFTELRANYTFRMVPVAKGRPRTAMRGGRATTYTPEETRQFEQDIARIAYMQHSTKGYPELTGRLAMDAAFYVSNRRNDIDNFGKSLIDGIQFAQKQFGRTIFKNDSQFDWCSFRRMYVPKGREGIECTITGIEDNGFTKLDFEGPF